MFGAALVEILCEGVQSGNPRNVECRDGGFLALCWIPSPAVDLERVSGTLSGMYIETVVKRTALCS